MNKHRGSDADEYIFESADEEKMERQPSPNEHSGMNESWGYLETPITLLRK